MLYDIRRSTLILFSAHTLEAFSKDKLPCLSLLSGVANLGWSVSDQGCDWSPFGDALSMCRSSADGDAYDASMMSRDAQGFFCECCGMWAVSKISQDVGLKSSWICESCESCEKAAGSFAFVDFGQVDYLYSGTTEANGDVTVGQQLVQW